MPDIRIELPRSEGWLRVSVQCPFKMRDRKKLDLFSIPLLPNRLLRWFRRTCLVLATSKPYFDCAPSYIVREHRDVSVLDPSASLLRRALSYSPLLASLLLYRARFITCFSNFLTRTPRFPYPFNNIPNTCSSSKLFSFLFQVIPLHPSLDNKKQYSNKENVCTLG